MLSNYKFNLICLLKIFFMKSVYINRYNKKGYNKKGKRDLKKGNNQKIIKI